MKTAVYNGPYDKLELPDGTVLERGVEVALEDDVRIPPGKDVTVEDPAPFSFGGD